MRKGIILAGGLGSRFYPSTKGVSKHLFPIYDKPMIYYPLSTLMLAGINQIAIIGNKENLPIYQKLLGNGNNFGISLTYLLQNEPNGIPEALVIGKKFLNGKPCALILGDNIFYGSGFVRLLQEANNKLNECSIFLCPVKDPRNFGIAELGKNNRIIDMYEKPSKTSNNNKAITGLYFFDSNASSLFAKLKVSKRGEVEIVDLLKIYLERNSINSLILGRGFMWFDAGTPSSLIKASTFIESIQSRQGSLIGSPEEVSFNNGWISKDKILKNIKIYKNSIYGKYLSNFLSEYY